MKKFWKNPKFDQCCGMIFMLCAVWIKDTTLAVAAAALYLGGVIEEGRVVDDLKNKLRDAPERY